MLTQKGVPWNFSDDCRSTFLLLKEAFTSAPILTHWIPDALIIVETDVSDYAISRIISIRCKDDEIHPVAFHLQMLTAPELNYDTHDKELLAIHDTFRFWRTTLKVPEHPLMW